MLNEALTNYSVATPLHKALWIILYLPPNYSVTWLTPSFISFLSTCYKLSLAVPFASKVLPADISWLTPFLLQVFGYMSLSLWSIFWNTIFEIETSYQLTCTLVSLPCFFFFFPSFIYSNNYYLVQFCYIFREYRLHIPHQNVILNIK